MKMKIRIVPLLLNYYKILNQVPAHIALGFAAYLVFSRPQREDNGLYFGLDNGASYRLNDDSAPYLFEKYSQHPDNFVSEVLGDEQFWGINFKHLVGFIAEVEVLYVEIISNGMGSALHKLNVAQFKEV